MPISSDIVGRTGDPITQEIDSGWVTAYSNAVGASAESTHPLFPVCLEWPLFLDSRSIPTDLEPADLFRGVHADHDLTVHRPIRAGMRVTTRATIAVVESRRSGAYQRVRLDTVNDGGDPISTTWFGMVYRGLDVSGGDRRLDDAVPDFDAVPIDGDIEDLEICVAVDAATTYAHAARIWNPIHTDPTVAEAAGLPGTILQGTATLAMAVSAIVEERCGGDAGKVVGVAARFGAMVFMPSTLRLRVDPARDGTVRFEVLTPDGGRAIRDGLITARSLDSGSANPSA